MKGLAFVSFALSAVTALATGSYVGMAPLVVGNVNATVDVGTHLLRVTYDLANENSEQAYVTLDVQTNGVSIGWDKFRTLSGDVTKLSDPLPVACGTGKELVWNAPADWQGNLGADMTVKLTAHYTNAIQRIPGVYMKIDVSGGAEAVSYPVSYSFVGPDMTDSAKPWAKDIIWLRCIGPGSFMMGSPTGETGRQSNEVLHGVTLTKPFYIGVFEVTEYQYRKVMDALPPALSTAKGDTRPVTQCSYNILRGTTYSWPTSGRVDADTFIGVLRAKTGLDDLDLPTEAQWEYACRAGTTTALHNGKAAATGNAEANSHWLRYIAWFKGNRDANGPSEVGTKAPNNWRLYDMIGNAYELVLDWYADNISAYTLDPAGPATGSNRILRSGAYDADFYWERSAFRLSWGSATAHNAVGFRLGMRLD